MTGSRKQRSWHAGAGLGTGLLLCLLLPLVGVWLAGEPVGQYWEFPPLTRYVQHAPFSWPAFVLIGLAVAGLVAPLVAGLVRGGRQVRGSEAGPTGAAFPVWGWAGLLLTGVAWILAWTRLEWFAGFQRHTFFPLWLGYILTVSALTQWRTGSCRMLRRPFHFLLLFGVSAAFWWFFEYLNRFVQNWHYMNIAGVTRLEYVTLGSVSFSTVLPAVSATEEFLESFAAVRRGFSGGRRWHVPHPRALAGIVLALAGVGLLGIGVLPDLLYPLLWVSPLLLILGSSVLAGRSTRLDAVPQGDWRPVAVPALAALVCGFFWEMWNVRSLAAWEYSVPFVGRFHLFEMPVLGYGGYLPFGIECALIADAVSAIPDRVLFTATGKVKSVWVRAVGAVCAVLALVTAPFMICVRNAERAWHDRPDYQAALAAGAAEWVEGEIGADDFKTGDPLFDGEWLFGTYMMSAMGHGQAALNGVQDPSTALARMEQCFEKMRAAEVRQFDARSWGSDPLESLESDDHHHAAYLGYQNLALSLAREVERRARLAGLAPTGFSEESREWNRRITRALARRLEQSPTLLLQTYPNEHYPVDNAAVISSIALYDRGTGQPARDLVRQWMTRCRSRYVDPEWGLLIQAVYPDGAPLDGPRGSGTLLGAYFLAYADREFSRELYAAARRHLARSVLNFGLVREYPPGNWGLGDIDSGPVLLGFGVSSTGFMIATTRIHGDFVYFRQLAGTAHLAGSPYRDNGRLNWLTGTPIGDAILFAMFTAPKADVLELEGLP